MAETLTGRERFLAALERREPDRVPIFELFIHPRIVEALVPGGDYADFVDCLGIDAALTSTPSSLYARKDIGEEGGTRLIQTEWGEVRALTSELVPIPIRHPVNTRADWEQYTLPEVFPERLAPLDRLLARFKGQRAIGVHLHDALSYPSYILGMTDLFLKLHDDPDLVRDVIRASVDHTAALLAIAAAKGADFLVLGDDYGGKAGPLISPPTFQDFFLPGIRRLVELAKGEGMFVIKHTDGNVNSILEMLIDTGIDAFHPSDPSAGMDIVEVKHQWGDRICVIGGIDAGDPLSRWPERGLVDETRRRIRELGRGGGWVISSSNSLHSSVRPENYLAMVWAVRAFGQSDGFDRYQPIPELESRFPDVLSGLRPVV